MRKRRKETTKELKNKDLKRTISMNSALTWVARSGSRSSKLIDETSLEMIKRLKVRGRSDEGVDSLQDA